MVHHQAVSGSGLRWSWQGTGRLGRQAGWRAGRWSASPVPSSRGAAAACAPRSRRVCSATGQPRATRSGSSTRTPGSAAAPRLHATTRLGGRPPPDRWCWPRTGPPRVQSAAGRGGSSARSSVYRIVVVSISSHARQTFIHSFVHSSPQGRICSRTEDPQCCQHHRARQGTRATNWRERIRDKRRDKRRDTVERNARDAEIRTGAAILTDWLDGWLAGWLDGWMDGWMDEWMDGWMDGQIDGRTDGWQDGQTAVNLCRRVISPNWIRALLQSSLLFLYFFNISQVFLEYYYIILIKYIVITNKY